MDDETSRISELFFQDFSPPNSQTNPVSLETKTSVSPVDDIDLERLKEFAARPFGTQEKFPNFQGFILDAFQEYTRRYLNHMVFGEVKTFEYPGKNSAISLEMISTRTQPDLSSLRLIGQLNDPSTLLLSLSGKISADFSPFPIEYIFSKRLKVNRDYTAKLDDITLYFSENPNTPNLVRRIEFERKPSVPKIKNLLSSTFQVLNAAMSSILTQAECITLENNFYAYEDERKDLIKETCTIIHPSEVYPWSYNIQAPEGRPLPSYLFPRASSLFSLIQGDFDNSSFTNMKIIEENQGGEHAAAD